MDVRDGKYERYNQTGTLEESGTFADGQKNGTWKWYDRGVEVFIGKFEDGKMVYKEDKVPSKAEVRKRKG